MTRLPEYKMEFRFKQKESWPLWLPEYFQQEKVDILSKVAKMFISHVDIYGTKYTLAELKKDLSELPKDGVVIACSVLSLALSVRDGSSKKMQSELARQFFTEQDLPKIIKYLNEDRLLFFEHQFLGLSKTAIVWCQEKGSAITQEQIGMFSKCLLGTSDLLNRDYEGEKLLTTKGQVSFFFNTYDINFPTWNSFGTHLGRLEQLWNAETGLVFKYAQKVGLDLKKEFESDTGHLTIDEFIAMSFALVAYYLRFIKPRSEWPRLNVLLSEMFKKYADQNSIQDFENLMCIDNINELGKPNDPFFFTDFSNFRRRPLVHLADGSVIPVSLNLLCSRISESIYWTLHQRFSGNQPLLNSFTSAFGHAFEEYTRGLISWARPLICRGLPTVHFDVPYLQGQKKSTDIILEYPGSLIFLEVTSSRPMAAARARGDIEKIEEYIEKRILPKARSLNNSIQDFRNGLMDLQLRPYSHSQRIFPIIVLYSDFPVVPPIWELINEIFRKNDVHFEEPLTIISAEELELLTAMIQRGFSLERLIIDMHDSLLYRKLNIRVFLLDRLNGEKINNDFVYDSFETRAKSVLLRFFPERSEDIGAIKYAKK